MSEKATRHPFDGWVADSLGESNAKAFAADTVVTVYGVDPGGSTEPASGVDAQVRTTPTLYFRGVEIPASEHDEWTVRGVRYEQEGPAAVWRSPATGRVAGTVIRLKGRTG